MNKILIKCNGYWLDGMCECVYNFEHIGHWGDKELKTHEEYEEQQVGKHGPFWLGFDEISVFKIGDMRIE